MVAPTLHTTMADLVGGWPSARTVLARRGMACVGCSMASFETISEAAVAYGFDPGEFIGEIIAARPSLARAGRSSKPGVRRAGRRGSTGRKSR